MGSEVSNTGYFPTEINRRTRCRYHERHLGATIQRRDMTSQKEYPFPHPWLRVSRPQDHLKCALIWYCTQWGTPKQLNILRTIVQCRICWLGHILWRPDNNPTWIIDLPSVSLIQPRDTTGNHWKSEVCQDLRQIYLALSTLCKHRTQCYRDKVHLEIASSVPSWYVS